jgi:hypothetical protein
VVGACQAAITSGLMQRHPGLRIGFIEASGSWLPWVIKAIRRRAEGRKLPEHVLAALRIFVTCDTSETSGTLHSRLARAC